MPAWEEKGYALYAGPEHEKWNKATVMTPDQFKILSQSSPGSFILVDVREPKDFSEGHIPGAINIPVSRFTPAAGLDRHKKIIVYCNTGARSYNAFRKLQKMSFPNIGQVTFSAWKDAGMPIEK